MPCCWLEVTSAAAGTAAVAVAGTTPAETPVVAGTLAVTTPAVAGTPVAAGTAAAGTAAVVVAA